MGPCVSTNDRPRTNNFKDERQKQAIWQSNTKLSQSEVDILRLIYQDLASRSANLLVNIEDFLLFFHKNGFWGNRLFKQFAFTYTNQLTEQQFVIGIGKIFKATERQKIMMLFKFFSQGQTGVDFSQFLIMLYNYPKQDLKEILNDKAFIQYQLSKRLANAQVSGQKFQSGGGAAIRMNSTQILRHQMSLAGQQLSKKQREPLKRQQGKKEQHELVSLIGREIINQMSKKREVNKTVLHLNSGQKVLDIKTINIQQVVKKFAYSVFEEVNIDPKTGKFNSDQFYDWISAHPALYQNYYSGFHSEIWQQDQKTKQSRYLTASSDKIDIVKIWHENQYIFFQMFLFHNILVLCPQKKLYKPFKVVCLDGLTVKQCTDKDHGPGIEVTHRDGKYGNHKLFFKNQTQQLQWMELLKYFKGDSIRKRYKIGQKIGTGKFSVVYKGEHMQQKKNYAIKQIITLLLDNEARQLIAHESSIMQIVQHPLLLEFKECIQTRTHLYIITELVEGKDLFDFTKIRCSQDHSTVGSGTLLSSQHGNRSQRSKTLKHNGKQQTIQVVVDEEGQILYVKLIDFGFSNYLSKLNQGGSQARLCGTPNYIAPEILKNQPIDFKIDNFAVGIILFFMLTSMLPFNDHQMADILQNTKKGEYIFPEQIEISAQAKDLIDKLIKNNPKERIGLKDALKHPWFGILSKKRQETLRKVPTAQTQN